MGFVVAAFAAVIVAVAVVAVAVAVAAAVVAVVVVVVVVVVLVVVIAAVVAVVIAALLLLLSFWDGGEVVAQHHCMSQHYLMLPTPHFAVLCNFSSLTKRMNKFSPNATQSCYRCLAHAHVYHSRRTCVCRAPVLDLMSQKRLIACWQRPETPP